MPRPKDSVVLIERDPLVREGLYAVLSAWGFKVSSAADPSEILVDRDRATAPNLAVLSTPRGDAAIGVEWIAALRLHYRDLLVVLVADDSAPCITLSNCVHVGWPAKTTALRQAIEAISSADADTTTVNRHQSPV